MLRLVLVLLPCVLLSVRDIWPCNFDAYSNGKIDALSAADLEKINELKQVQIWFRHGIRLWDTLPSDYFPSLKNSSQHCNVTAIIHNNIFNQNNYNNKVKLNKIYVENEQIIPNSNCMFGQSLYATILQMRDLSNIIKDAYIGNDSYNIFSKNYLQNEISNNNNLSNTLILIANDMERTISAALAFLNGLLSNSINNNSIQYVHNLIVHDFESDPLFPWGNRKCLKQTQFNEFMNRRSNDPIDNIDENRRNYLRSSYVSNIIKKYENEGGLWLNDGTSYEVANFYCQGVDIPLSNNTLFDILNVAHEWRSIYTKTEHGHQRENCFYYTMSIPFLYILKHNILQMINDNDSNPKMVIYSGRFDTLEFVLESLEMYDFEAFANAEMVTFEIYSSKINASEYLFRFTRKGEFLPYKYCDYNGTELCDLNILLNKHLNESIVDFNEWQNNICPYMLDECRCGFCNDAEDKNEKQSNFNSDMFVGVVIGIIVGIFVSLIIIYVIYKTKYCCAGTAITNFKSNGDNKMQSQILLAKK